MIYVSTGLRFKLRKGCSIYDPARYNSLFLHPPPHRHDWRKKDGSSLLFKLFVWKQRQRSASRFWIRIMTEREKKEREADRKIQWSPLPLENYFRASGWNKSRHRGTNNVMKAWRISRKMTHFFHLQRECMLIKAMFNTMLKRESFFFFGFFVQLYRKSYGT